MIQVPFISVDNAVNRPTDLVAVMQRQNDITKSLIKQQRLSTLPSPNIPAFKGDPLKYHLFIRAFEHRIERKRARLKTAKIDFIIWNSTQMGNLMTWCAAVFTWTQIRATLKPRDC